MIEMIFICTLVIPLVYTILINYSRSQQHKYFKLTLFDHYTLCFITILLMRMLLFQVMLYNDLFEKEQTNYKELEFSYYSKCRGHDLPGYCRITQSNLILYGKGINKRIFTEMVTFNYMIIDHHISNVIESLEYKTYVLFFIICLYRFFIVPCYRFLKKLNK
jgi:hypothetical protein